MTLRHIHKDFLAKTALVFVGLVSIGASIVIILATRESRDSVAQPTSFTVGESSADTRSCFAPAKISLTGAHGSDSVAIGDLNGDGKPDLATVALEANTVAVLTNNGDGSFRPDAEYRTGKRPDSVAIADLNGDGKSDLATSNAAGSVSVLLNGRDGTFGPRVDYRVGEEPLSLAIGDLNGDRKPDLLVTDQAPRETSSVLLNGGDGSFGAEAAYPTGWIVGLGDLNGDGKKDLAALDSDRTVAVLLNRGDGSFAGKVDYRTGDGPSALTIGDLNADGKLDLATANFGIEPMGVGNTVSVLLNKGDGSFRPKRDFETAEYPTSVAIGDANGDGKPDVVTADAETEAISVLLNRGDGSFSTRLEYPKDVKPGGAESAAIVDVNGDGEPDLLANHWHKVSVLLNAPGPCTERGVGE